jgi:hypothetical protein
MSTPAAGEYRDRKTGLIIFGILEILLGAFCWLMVPLMFLSMAIAGRRAGASAVPATLLPAAGIYALAGTAIIWLGIGSILVRRWARALWVCLSGVGFATGVLAIPFGMYLALVELPRTMAANGQPAPAFVAPLVQIIVLCFLLIFYLIIPGVLLFFYGNVNVKRTCEARDAKECWTDRCPLPVLALSLFTAIGGLMMLLCLTLQLHGAFPVFGIFATGAAGYALGLAYAGTALYAAWGLYRLKIGSWWLWLVVMLLVAISGAITLWHGDLQELYTRMGFDMRMASQAGDLARKMKWMSPVWFLPWLGWMLYVRRYFPRAARTDTMS